MDKRKAYEEKFEAQLKEWSAQIALLQAKADKIKAEAKIEYCETIESLQLKHKDARAKLDAIKNSGDAAWEEIKTGAEKSWDDAATAIRAALSKFQ